MAPLASLIDTCIQEGREHSGYLQTCDQTCLNKITTCVLAKRSELTDSLCENSTSMAVLKSQMNQMQFEIDSVRDTFVKKGDIDTSAFALKSDFDMSSVALKSDLTGLKNDLKGDMSSFALKSDLVPLRSGLDTSSFARTSDLNELKSELTKMMSEPTKLEGMASKSDLEGLASKSDLEGLASKSDLEGLASKSDLDKLASKTELEELASKTQRKGNYATTTQVSGLNDIVDGFRNRLTRANIPL